MNKVYKVGRRGRKAVWVSIVAGWRASGLTREAYCQQEELKFEDLKRWCYRVKQEQRIDQEKEAVQSQALFLPVEISEEQKGVGQIKLEHRGGFSIEVGADTDKTLLQEVIKLLAGVLC